MLKCAEQVQIPKYKTHAYKRRKTAMCPNNHAQITNYKKTINESYINEHLS